jgi:hypothetical protein
MGSSTISDPQAVSKISPIAVTGQVGMYQVSQYLSFAFELALCFRGCVQILFER